MSRWTRIRGSFWFLPAVLCGLSVVLAETLILVDRRLGEMGLGPLGVLVNRIGAAGSRDVLGAIAGSVLTVAATSFSITIAVLATASSTYGPRLVRNFMADRGNRFVLGVYTATFLYSLLVLRSIRAPDDSDQVFVPHLAVTVAVLSAVLAIGVLVYFINHIADSVQVFTLARQVRDEFLEAVDRLYPEDLGRAPEDDGASAQVPPRMDADGVAARSGDAGYLASVAEDRLLALAVKHDLVLALRLRPGQHVLEGGVLATVWPPDRADADRVGKIADCFQIAQARTPHQDVEFTVLILEEMAVRALSPGTNDPYTALNALDELAAGLVRLAGRSMPSPHRLDESRRLRVIAPRVSLVELLDRVFDAVRHYAVDHPTVLARTLDLAVQVGNASRNEPVRERLAGHVDRILEAYERSSPQSCDLTALRERATRARRELLTGPGHPSGSVSAPRDSAPVEAGGDAAQP